MQKLGKTMRNKKPLISVVMPVYNGEKYLKEAIDSILSQTYKDFEFIILNDGSTDNSLKIIKKYIQKDARVILITRENRGLITSLNEGIKKAQGRYIARMDADDISLPTRFKEQVKFMEDNKDISICGTSIILFNESGNIKPVKYPTSDSDIKFILMFTSAFAHPSVMMKRDIFMKLKYEHYKYAEDYKLWIDIALAGYKMGNLDEVLLRYRIHSQQVSIVKNDVQLAKSHEMGMDYLNHLENTQDIIDRLDSMNTKATPDSLGNLLKAISIYAKKLSISDNALLGVYRTVFRRCSVVSLKHFFIYLHYTKKLKKDFKSELYLLSRSILHLDRRSNIYQFLKKIILK